MAAQFVTPESINFMTKEARGFICLALTPERCAELGGLCAAEVIGHFGARPEADLRALAREADLL